MPKKIFISFLILLSAIVSKAAIGDWKLYTSYHNATYCEVINDKVYILASGALYSYQEEDEEIRLYDKISHLNDINILFIKYCKEIEGLVIVYENANIDIMYNDESVYNISDFKNKSMTEKVINNLSIVGKNAYISTNFGIVELDLERKEFNNTYTLNKNIISSYYFNGNIYASSDEGILRGNINDNLLDLNNWNKINSIKATDFCEFKGELFFIVNSKGIYTLNDNNIISEKIKISEKYNYIYKYNEQLVTGGANSVIIMNGTADYSKYDLDGKSIFIKTTGNEFWNCKGYNGIVKAKKEGNSITDNSESIIPDSPKRNYCEYMTFSGDKLLIAGGNLNYFDINFYDATIMEYYYKEDRWHNYDENEVKEAIGQNLLYRNICTIDEDPLEEGHLFAGSFGHGIFEFREGEFIKHYNYDNSPLESVVAGSPKYIRISKVKFDKEGNLWVVNTGMKNIIKVLKSDGTWQELYYRDIQYVPTASDIYFDSRGWLWVVSLQQDAGLFCAKINDTPLDTSDDETKSWFAKFTNQDGISYDIYQIYGFAEDKNGQIWVGTNTGLFVIENPKTFFSKGTFTQIKIPRNDGTGLADYLLNGVYIQSIFIDGANRKWIGTKNNGIYLISSDGQETIHHFTTENSPLPSNSIVSIAVNEESGEVFIGTEKGLASFMGNATEPEETLNENNIHAYPNPVRADYSGDISIVGLTFDCNIKIVDAAGSLINEGTSTGGSYTWDGRNRRGEKVASGVYYVLTYDENGNEGVATKILIIK